VENRGGTNFVIKIVQRILKVATSILRPKFKLSERNFKQRALAMIFKFIKSCS